MEARFSHSTGYEFLLSLLNKAPQNIKVSLPYDLPTEWCWVYLEDVCERVSVGHVGLTSEYFCNAGEGIPFIRSQNVRPGRLDLSDIKWITKNFHYSLKKSQLQQGDILIVRVGHNRGDCCVVPDGLGELNCANIVFARPYRGLSKFLGFYFRSEVGQSLLRSISTGSAQGVLNTRSIAKLPVPIPPPHEIEAIAHILGTLDDKIELNQQMNRTLEAIARALFKSWFIDFDPVRAKLDGRQPAGMDAETAALFPAEFEDGGAIGKIPKGWKVGLLGDVVEVNSRSITKSYPHKLIQYVDISSVTVGRLEGTTVYELSNAPSRAKRLVQHGDTIWSGVRPNRKSYLFIHTPPKNLVVSTGFIVLSPKSIPPSYLYAWVTTEEFVDYLAFNADGSAYPAVRPDRFSDAQMLIPLKVILDKFEQQAGSIRDKIIQNEHESITLASIRDVLLPKLLSGEIRVKEAEKIVAEVA